MGNECCPVCGFEWDAVRYDEIVPRLQAVSLRFEEAFGAGSRRLTERRPDGVWTGIEYGSHVRDLLFNLRDRIVVGLVQDNPTPKPTFAVWRVDAGLYASDRPDELAVEIPIAARLMIRMLERLDSAQTERRLYYAWPRPTSRTVRWVAAQALHECEHHYADVAELLS